MDNIVRKYSVDTSRELKNVIFIKDNDGLPLRLTDVLTVYTDGSKRDDRVGFGWIAIKQSDIIETTMIRLDNLNSVFQSEALALLSAVTWVIERKYDKAIFYTDSNAVYMSLQCIYPKSEIIKKIRDLCLGAVGTTFVMGWVKAHRGCVGNECADTLAVQATTLMDSSPYKVPFASLKRHIRNNMIKQWQVTWNNATTGRFTKNILTDVSEELRFDSQVIIYFISGQGSFPSYLNTIGKLDNANCQCGAHGDPHHYSSTRCSYSDQYIKKRTRETLYEYYKRIENSNTLLNRLKAIYNQLKDTYSFIYSAVA